MTGPVSEPVQDPVVESELTELVAELAELSVDELDVETPFAEAGIDSLLAMEIAVHIESRFDVRFGDEEVRGAQTIRDLARLVSEHRSTRDA